MIPRSSLDRGDLWDERPSPRFTEIREHFNWKTMQGLVPSNRMAEFNEILDSNYDYNGSPTKLPAGRLEITLDPSQNVEAFELNLATAEGVAKLTAGHQARVFVNAALVQEPVALLRLSGPPPREVRLKSPDSVQKLGYLWDRLPTFRQFAKDLYNSPGAAVPGVMRLAGQALGGWGQYSLSPTMGAWNAHLFYLHWRHTRDEQFLRARAYPFCREIAVCLETFSIMSNPTARSSSTKPPRSPPATGTSRT